MKIFISWAGKQSGIIAEGLNTWLPNVIQSIETFYSPNIEKGTRGGTEINATLEGTNFGIICLTSDNLDSRWIHYEAGALAKINDDNTRVWTLLLGLNASDVEQPLAQFQHTLADKGDVLKLLQSINSKLDKPLGEDALKTTFERWWPDFDEKIEKAKKVGNEGKDSESKTIRSDREILDEVLDILRGQSRLTTGRATLRRVNWTGGSSLTFPIDTTNLDGDASLEDFEERLIRLIKTNLPPNSTSYAFQQRNDDLLVTIQFSPVMPTTHVDVFQQKVVETFGERASIFTTQTLEN